MGKERLQHFNSSEKAASLIAGGDLSCIQDGAPRHYHAWRGEDHEPWDRVKPTRVPSEDTMIGGTEYLYLWDGERWLCDGEPLVDVLAREDDA